MMLKIEEMNSFECKFTNEVLFKFWLKRKKLFLSSTVYLSLFFKGFSIGNFNAI